MLLPLPRLRQMFIYSGGGFVLPEIFLKPCIRKHFRHGRYESDQGMFSETTLRTAVLKLTLLWPYEVASSWGWPLGVHLSQHCQQRVDWQWFSLAQAQVLRVTIHLKPLSRQQCQGPSPGLSLCRAAGLSLLSHGPSPKEWPMIWPGRKESEACFQWDGDDEQKKLS